MGTLTSCLSRIEKTGATINAADKAAIFARSLELRTGPAKMAKREADAQAVREQLETVRAMLADAQPAQATAPTTQQFSQKPKAEVHKLKVATPSGMAWVTIYNGGSDERFSFHATEADARAAAETWRPSDDAGRDAGRDQAAGNEGSGLPAGRQARAPELRLTPQAQKVLDRRDSAVKTTQELNARKMAGTIKQDSKRAGHCYGLSAAASMDGLGSMVIGRVQDSLGNVEMHAVVERDGYIYDAMMRQWFAPGVYEADGFTALKTISPDEVRAYVARNDGDAPNALNQGLADKDGKPAQSFKQTKEAPAGWSVAETQDSPSTVESVRAEIAELFDGDTSAVITILESADGLPDRVRDKFKAAGAIAVTLDRKHIYIVAPRVTRGTARGVVMHELGVHVGLSAGDVAAFKAQIKRWAQGTGQLADMAKLALRAEEGSSSTNKSDEAVAYMVQFMVDAGITPNSASTPSAKSLLSKIIDAIRAAAQSLGLNLRGDITPHDMVNYVHGAAKMALRKAAQQEQGDTSFAQTASADPNNADIRFSQTGPIARAVAAQFEGTITGWDKTVGTPYNLAKRKPQFGVVFDRLNDFINGISTYANAAADKAPNWLPSLRGLRDIANSPVKAKDSAAAAKPIFEGTLVWMRDSLGKPVKVDEARTEAEGMDTDDKARALVRGNHLAPNVMRMWQGMEKDRYDKLIADKFDRDVLAPGIVFTPAELKSIFGLTDKQVALYNEFRAGVGKSLDDMTTSAMLRVGGKQTADLCEQAMGMPMDDAAELLRDRMYELAAAETDKAKKKELDDAGDMMIDLADKAGDLKRRGYAPLMRFGDRTATVLDASGEMLYFGMYESGWERQQGVAKLREMFPGAQIKLGTTSKEEFKLFSGVAPETLELFGDIMGEKIGFDTTNPVYQEYVRRAKANQSGLKRLLKRKGTAGFREEPARVLASFIYSNARQTSGNLHAAGITEAISEIDRTDGELKDYAVQLDEYVRQPKEEAQAIRGLMFTNFIGGSVASAMVNLTQPVNVTLPWLTQHDAMAAAKMTKALGLMWLKSTGNAKLDAAVKKAEEEGTLAPQEVHHLLAQARGAAQLQSGEGVTGNAAAAGNNALTRLAMVWGAPFSLAEAFNRRLTFIAAYMVAEGKNMADPAQFAETAVDETQYVYTKVNTPQWARGAIGATLFTFKKFSISWVEGFVRMSRSGPQGKAAALFMLAMIVLAAGVEGLPFREDLEDLIDGFANRVLDREFQAKAWRRKLMNDVFGEFAANLLNSGISGLPGVPIDVSGRLGLHNLIPGTGAFPKKKDYGRDIAEVGGAAGGLLKQYAEAAALAAEGNLKEAALKAAPVAAQNVAKGIDMNQTGKYRDTRGNVVKEVTQGEAVAKGIGFQPRSVAEKQSDTFMQQRRIALVRQVESEMVDEIASGIFLNDKAKEKAGYDRLETWNKNNPESPIVIKPEQIRTRVKNMGTDKAERILKTAPKELRPSVREGLGQ